MSNSKERMVVNDFGAGISLDELVGLSAWQIDRLVLPSSKVFHAPVRAARLLIGQGLESYLLAEIWEDGHSVWLHPKTDEPLIVEPTGHLTRGKTE